MPRLRLPDDVAAVVPPDQAAALAARFDAVRRELDIPEAFPPEVLAEADRAAAAALPQLPDDTAVPYFTIDPPGSMDLDQAMHLERDGSGYRVRYAIADVPFFVAPGGALDAETRHRACTVYTPDRRTPLHPPVLSEGAASLLPGQVRPAYVWDFRLDDGGEVTASAVARRLVRSVERLDYGGVQGALDGGSADERFTLLREIGERRVALEQARGGASLNVPEQEVSLDDHAVVHLTFRPPRPTEDWNAQISLLTGMAAARFMLDAQVGILRTLPPAPEGALARLRRQAGALGVSWPRDLAYGAWLRTLDRADPHHLALLNAATALFRGAGYTPFDGAAPQLSQHAAVAAPYAHVTAPLRRLVDRFGLAVCAAVSAGDEVPGWAREALPLLPDAMELGDRKARAVERACADAVEAAVLAARVGEVFAAVVIGTEADGVEVQLVDEPVIARTKGTAPLGSSVQVRLVGADVAAGRVAFAIAGPPAG